MNQIHGPENDQEYWVVYLSISIEKFIIQFLRMCVLIWASLIILYHFVYYNSNKSMTHYIDGLYLYLRSGIENNL